LFIIIAMATAKSIHATSRPSPHPLPAEEAGEREASGPWSPSPHSSWGEGGVRGAVRGKRTHMAERSFKQEVKKLRLGAGQEFRGEGILAVTKALLQAGVSYVSGYQG